MVLDLVLSISVRPFTKLIRDWPLLNLDFIDVNKQEFCVFAVLKTKLGSTFLFVRKEELSWSHVPSIILHFLWKVFVVCFANRGHFTQIPQSTLYAARVPGRYL